MKKVLKYIGKGQWIEVDAAEVAPGDKVLSLVRKRITRTAKTDLFFEQVKKDIANNGYRSIRCSILLGQHGIKKRSEKNLRVIRDALASRGIYSHPEISLQTPLNCGLRLYHFPVRQYGDLFESERALEDFVAQHQLYTQLGITEVSRQHSPLGTKDVLDFKGITEANDLVVLELKNKGGGKSAVEQVLRYTGILKMQFPLRNIRTILVTGIQNYETALAIQGLYPEQRRNLEWYIYDYKRDGQKFQFLKVADNDLDLLSSAAAGSVK